MIQMSAPAGAFTVTCAVVSACPEDPEPPDSGLTEVRTLPLTPGEYPS